MAGLKKIVIIGPAWPLRGGISLFNVRMCNALADKGVETHIVGFSRQFPQSFFPGRSQYTPEPKPAVGIPMIDTCNPFSWKTSCAFIKKLKPDAVVFAWWHFWFWPCYRVMGTLLSRSGIPVVFLCHNYTTHDQSDRGRWFADDLSKTASGLIFLSRFTQRQYRKRSGGGDPPPAVSLFHPDYEWKEWPLTPLKKWSGKIFWGGCLKTYKGLELCLGVLSLDEHLHLTISGDVYKTDLLKRLATAGKRFQNRLEVKTGYGSDEKLVALVDAHDMLLCSHIKATQSGMAAFALGRGRPVVTTPVGGFPEQINRRVGVVAEQATPESLLKAIYQIYEKPPQDWASEIAAQSPERSFSYFADQFCRALETMAAKS